MLFIITIDGGSGIGKSTIAAKVAKKLNFHYLNTGLFFRALAYYFSIHEYQDIVTELKKIESESLLQYQNNSIYLDNKIILLTELTTEKIAIKASKIAVISDVREFIKNWQQKVAITNLVVEGRDIGTLIFPQAILKIFLTASIITQANRRYKQLKDTNNLNQQTFDEILIKIIQRDNQDTNRTIAPLKCADDAIIINTDNYLIDQIVEQIVNLFNNKIKI